MLLNVVYFPAAAAEEPSNPQAAYLPRLFLAMLALHLRCRPRVQRQHGVFIDFWRVTIASPIRLSKSSSDNGGNHGDYQQNPQNGGEN
jgi:hypothetical protein